mmetsp:Transcript_19657/g.40791  ORF Transcript_19657/g.40791 Transcript_19657/m.40791 type:complete len:87 (+) Transcript_19657:38-298(+)
MSLSLVRDNGRPGIVATAAKKKKHPLEHFLAGGTAGLVESSCCHPLDTIKTRMQLRKQIASAKAIGPLTTATRIIKREVRRENTTR